MLSDVQMQPRGDRPVIVSFRLEHLLGWGLTAALCIVPVILWLQIHPLSTISGYSSTLLALGRLTGLVGLVMYALNLVYATRLRFLEPMFGGLNRVYIAHHFLGGLAFILLAFHPLFLSMRFLAVSAKEAALLLLPNGLTPVSALFTESAAHEIVVQQWAIFFGILAFWVMAGLLLVTFFIKIPYRIWFQTHRYLGAAFFLIGLHVLFVSSDTSTNLPLKYYMLGMCAIGIAAFVYRTLGREIFVRHYSYVVESVQAAGGNVAQISLRPAAEQMRYKPGQFIFVRFLDARAQHIGREWHPFSISSGPHDALLRVSVKGLGDYTNLLQSLQPGTHAEIEGAYGKFTYTNFKNLNQIWIAGGIGVTPFISMARALPESGFRIDLYYSVKTESEVINWQELYDIAMSRGGQFRVFPYVGDKQPGHLTADYIETTSGGVKGKEIFICGPPPMMKSLRQQFRDKAVPGTSIHSEEFGMA